MSTGRAACDAPGAWMRRGVWIGASAMIAAQMGCSATAVRADPVAEFVGGRAVRFFPSEEAAGAKRPSPAFLRKPERVGEVPDDFSLVPRWEQAAEGTVATLEIPADATLYGLGAAPGGLIRKPGRYESDTSPPLVVGVRADGTAFGMMLDSTWDAAVVLEAGTMSIETRDPAPAVYVFESTTPTFLFTDIFGRLGGIEMPALWAMGVLGPRSLHQQGLALDGVWANEDLKEALRGSAKWVLARPLAEEPANGAAGDGEGTEPLWIQTHDGEALQIQGRRVADFTAPATREWWKAQADSWGDAGAFGVRFDGDVLTRVPDSAQLAGDEGLGGAGTAEQYRGVMGLLASRAAWEGYSPEERDRRMLLVLPTTNLGAQRWTANRVEFGAGKVERARDLIAAALNSTMSAQPLVGAFVGGPEGIGMEEWERAISAASLMPLWSVEGLPTGRDREAAVELVRAAAEMRWQLLPYLYTQAFAMFYEGQPLLRPLVLARPDDPALRGTETAYMMGPDLLVAPALGEDTFEPDEHFAGVWERLPIGTADERLPRIYMRRGSIIPLAQPGQRPGGMELDPVTIVVALDEQGEAVGTLYEDEQETYSLFRGQTRRLTYRAKREGEVAFVRLAGLDGGWGLPRRQLSVRLLMESGEIDAVGTERGTMRIELGTTPGAP